MLREHQTIDEIQNRIYQDNFDKTSEKQIKEEDLSLTAMITLRAESGCSNEFEAMALCE